MRLYYILLGFSVAVGLAGQSLLKIGMRRFAGGEVASAQAAAGILWRALISPPVIAGGTLYVLGFGAWLLVLTRIEVSVALPMLSINYILITLVAWLFLGESINAYKIAGCLLIVTGVLVLSRGASPVAGSAAPLAPPAGAPAAPPPAP